MRPPQRGQASTSTGKTRWSSSAHVQPRGSGGLAGGSAGSPLTVPRPEVPAAGTLVAVVDGTDSARAGSPGVGSHGFATSTGGSVGAGSAAGATLRLARP